MTLCQNNSIEDGAPIHLRMPEIQMSCSGLYLNIGPRDSGPTARATFPIVIKRHCDNFNSQNSKYFIFLITCW